MHLQCFMENHSELAEQVDQEAWKPPVYSFPSSDSDSDSKLIFTVRPQEINPLSDTTSAPSRKKRKRNAGLRSGRKEEKIWRKATWSPDGTHVLAQSSSHCLDLFSFNPSTKSEQLQLRFTVQSPTPLLDAVWYPYARSDDPSTWCFAISSRDNPVKLIDASSAKVRVTYGIMDHVERFIGPQCLCFSLDGTRIYGGHSSKLYVLPVSAPGLNGHHLHALPSQKGIVSSISVTLDQETGTEILALGTFSGNTGIYAFDFSGWSQEYDADRSGKLTCLKGWKEEDGSGVSQLAFHPLNPNLLFVTCRKSKHDSVVLYDLNEVNEKPRFGLLAGQKYKSKAKSGEESRASVGDRSVVVRFLRRKFNVEADSHEEPHEKDDLSKAQVKAEEEAKQSQQRLYFSIDWSGRWLIAGNKQGLVNVWRIDRYATGDGSKIQDRRDSELEKGEEVSRSQRRRGSIPQPDFSWQAQQDSITSAMIHPLSSYLLTSSGARHWDPSPESCHKNPTGSGSVSESSSESDSEEEEEEEEDEDLVCRSYDASLKIFDLH